MSTRSSGIEARLLALAVRLMPRDLREAHGCDLLEGFARDRTRPQFAGLTGAARFWIMVGRDLARVRRPDDREDPSERPALLFVGWRDARDAARALRRAPGFTASAIAVAGLGTALAAGMFAVVERVLLAPLPVSRPAGLVVVNTESRGWTEAYGLSPFVYDAVERETSAFSSVGYYIPPRLDDNVILRGPDGPEKVRGLRVSPNFFDLLGVAPVLGRSFAHRGTSAALDEVLLSHAAWRTHYGGDPSLVGDSIGIDGRPHTIAGILPASFTLPVDAEPVDYWVARALVPQERAWANANFIWTVARLAAGATPASAAAETQAIAVRAGEARPDAATPTHMATVTPLDQYLEAGWRQPLALLFGGALVVLLIAGSSFSLLVLARHAARQHEFSVWLAIGADRASIVRRMAVEVLVLACAGAALGLLLAAAGYPLLLRLTPDVLPHLSGAMPLDSRLLLFGASAAALLTLLGVLFPLAHLRLWRPEASLRRQGRGAQAAAGAGLAALVVAGQCAAMALLVVVLGLTTTSLSRLLAIDPGFRVDGRYTLPVTIPAPAGLDGRARLARESARLGEILAALEAMPGIERAGAVSNLPLTEGWGGELYLEREPWPAGQTAPALDWEVAAPGYFEAAGIDVVAGRGFEAGDTAEAPLVAVVNEELARRLLPGREVLGLSITGESKDGPWRRIVGVVRDVRQKGLDAGRRPHMYIAQAQSYPFSAYHVVLSTRPGAGVSAADVRARVRAIDDGLVVGGLRPMATLVSASTARERLAAALVAVFAALAVALGVAGTWGVVSYSARGRQHELAVRSALGASRRALVRSAARTGLRPVAIGVAAGLALAFVASRMLASELYGIATWEPVTMGASVLTILVAAGLAVFTPAHRLSRVNPASALRGDP